MRKNDDNRQTNQNIYPLQRRKQVLEIQVLQLGGLQHICVHIALSRVLKKIKGRVYFCGSPQIPDCSVWAVFELKMKILSCLYLFQQSYIANKEQSITHKFMRIIVFLLQMLFICIIRKSLPNLIADFTFLKNYLTVNGN